MTLTHTITGPVVDDLTPLRTATGRLRNTLRLNALTSIVGGLAAAIAPGLLDGALGTRHPAWMRLVGVGLIAFAIVVGAVGAARVSRLLRGSVAVIVADTGWVFGSAVAVAAGWFPATGMIIVSGVAAMVATWAVLQTRHLVASRRRSAGRVVTADEQPPVEVAHVERVVDTDRDTAWAVITDHELYGRLAPNLSAVHATTGNGPSLERTCASRSGTTWSEACTLWDDHSRYEIAVDTSDYPYPLAVMRGSWSLADAPDGGVVVAMDFRYQPRPGLRGAVMAAAMQAGFPLVLRRILRGWEHEMRTRATSSPRR